MRDIHLSYQNKRTMPTFEQIVKAALRAVHNNTPTEFPVSQLINRGLVKKSGFFKKTHTLTPKGLAIMNK